MSLKPGQALWLSGYFAGLDFNLRTLERPAEPGQLSPGLPEVVAPAATRTLTILFGTETGNGKALAKTLAEAAQQRGLAPVVAELYGPTPEIRREVARPIETLCRAGAYVA